MQLFEVNVAGTARVVQGFLPLIKDSAEKKVRDPVLLICLAILRVLQRSCSILYLNGPLNAPRLECNVFAAGGGDLDQAGVHATGGQEGVPQRPLPHLQGRGEHAHALLGPRPRRAGGE